MNRLIAEPGSCTVPETTGCIYVCAECDRLWRERGVDEKIDRSDPDIDRTDLKIGGAVQRSGGAIQRSKKAELLMTVACAAKGKRASLAAVKGQMKAPTWERATKPSGGRSRRFTTDTVLA